MNRRAPLPSHVHGAAFRVRDVDFHGATPSRLRAADLQRPFTAVRSIGLDLDDLVDRCRAYEPLLRPGDAFSHHTAAELYGLPLPERPTSLHVSSPPGAAQARSKGVIGHRSSHELEVTIRHGLPVVPVPLVWCQLGAHLTGPDLVAVGDAIVTGKRIGGTRAPGLAEVVELELALRAWGSGRGARILAWALPRVRVGAESRPESLTRILLTGAGLPEPLLNHPVTVADGEVLHPDLAYPQWRIAFEYEGDGHRTDRRRWQRDIRRHRALEAAGWRVIRVTSDDLFTDPDAFHGRVRDHIALAERLRRA